MEASWLKKAWLAAGLLLVSLMPTAAKVSWGVRAGIARSSLVQKMDLDYHSGARLGYSVAGLADVHIYQRFSFRSEVALAWQGGSWLSEAGEDGFLFKHEVGGYSLQVPLKVAFNIPISGVKMTVFGGPAFDFHLSDALETRLTQDGSLVSTDNKGIKPFDLAVNGGISVEFKGVFFSIDILGGTSDRREEKVANESPVYQNNITFSLGYFFR
jgi:hypothetical protein